ncbi:unnamed protein product [Callosobruchus maculatus]|uniref:Uncharacterized protein n=1 Tax=Callosobruchus maculatus TaxID=64391 RepID=A0A653D4I3_CALMS|nr:unnamed protein product [Callosobruchus maculatus]
MMVIKVSCSIHISTCSFYKPARLKTGQMELKEVVNNWKQKGHIMAYFKDTLEPRPKDFLSKFLQGKE